MPDITDITAAWSAGTATAGIETWQVQEGAVYLSVRGSPDAGGGIRLERGEAVKIAAGKTVKYRLATGTAATINVEAFE